VLVLYCSLALVIAIVESQILGLVASKSWDFGVTKIVKYRVILFDYCNNSSYLLKYFMYAKVLAVSCDLHFEHHSHS